MPMFFEHFKILPTEMELHPWLLNNKIYLTFFFKFNNELYEIRRHNKIAMLVFILNLKTNNYQFILVFLLFSFFAWINTNFFSTSQQSSFIPMHFQIWVIWNEYLWFYSILRREPVKAHNRGFVWLTLAMNRKIKMQ